MKKKGNNTEMNRQPSHGPSFQPKIVTVSWIYNLATIKPSDSVFLIYL